MRGLTFQQMRYNLRAECGLATDSTVGQSENPALNVLLNRTYENLFDEHDWPHLDSLWFTKALSAGERYYDFPAGLNYEQVQEAHVYWGNVWLPTVSGFDTQVYNSFDSDGGARSDPVQKWRVYGGSQFEVWPIPATPVNFRFKGAAAWVPLVNDNDICLLDGTMIVLFAAAEKLAGKAKGKAVEAVAARRLDLMKARSSNASPAFRPGSAHEDRQRPRQIVVRVAS